jgi:hypothetical protein
MTPVRITRGGVTVFGEARGNIKIHCRGDGLAECQAADVEDLIAALTEYARLDEQGRGSVAKTEVTTRPEAPSAELAIVADEAEADEG